MLARIRLALADGPPRVPVPRRYRPAGAPSALDLPGLLALLEERLLDYHATVRRCDEAGLPATVAAVLDARGSHLVALAPGCPDGWWPVAVRDEPPLTTAALDGLDAVVTGCAVAVAETGTIVLDHEGGQGRRALTLVPDHHLLVVRAGQVVPAVPDAVAALDPRRPQTWVSGPSATSDIELSRVEGVHGPRRLDVVLVVDAPAGPPALLL